MVDPRLRQLEGLVSPVELSVLADYYGKELRDSKLKASYIEGWLSRQKEVDDAMLEEMVERLADILLGEMMPLSFRDGLLAVYAPNTIINKTHLRAAALAFALGNFEIDPSPIRIRMIEVMQRAMDKFTRKEGICKS